VPTGNLTKEWLAFATLFVTTLTTLIAVLANFIVGVRQGRAAARSAEAALTSAQPAFASVESAENLRRQEMERNGVAEICRVQSERLERLRSDMAEFLSICYMRPMSPESLENSQRQRALLLIARLRLMIFPHTSIGDTMNADLNVVQVYLVGLEPRKEGVNEQLWIRMSLNAMRLILTEEALIEERLIKGECIERRPLKPELARTI
jgi:hypothetical protein